MVVYGCIARYAGNPAPWLRVARPWTAVIASDTIDVSCPCSVLGAAAALLPAAAAKAADDAQGVASSRMSYSRFLEYLDMGRVKKVRGWC